MQYFSLHLMFSFHFAVNLSVKSSHLNDHTWLQRPGRELCVLITNILSVIVYASVKFGMP